jgi:hypothetical protein
MRPGASGASRPQHTQEKAESREGEARTGCGAVQTPTITQEKAENDRGMADCAGASRPPATHKRRQRARR